MSRPLRVALWTEVRSESILVGVAPANAFALDPWSFRAEGLFAGVARRRSGDGDALVVEVTRGRRAIDGLSRVRLGSATRPTYRSTRERRPDGTTDEGYRKSGTCTIQSGPPHLRAYSIIV